MITLTVEQLQDILREQKEITAKYITRNLTAYTWFNEHPEIDVQKAKDQLAQECLKSDYPNDFTVLKKYIK